MPSAQFEALGFLDRFAVNLPSIIEGTNKQILILTTNLEFTAKHLIVSLKNVIKNNEDNKNANFKIDILTMDPDANSAYERFVQLKPLYPTMKAYRKVLTESMEKVEQELRGIGNVSLSTYTTLPTQMFFVMDDQVVVATLVGGQSRFSTHFYLRGHGTNSFINHFNEARKSVTVVSVF